MVEHKRCSFCNKSIEPGTGKMYIKRDGIVFFFCSHKCQQNQLKLKRESKNVKWTGSYKKGITSAKKI
ncbi:MAG: 50S ribosomal protein L24e [Candidatus Thermoplasmatota archaeon]|jgi:large subunit ribosomal protein L24e|nr:50S ribosomal protein L24e [Candidatus Thermoplasmatota archaeon]MCL5963097.1 50S ribosomal protein L24e [Candidatus Thermoplasmatota archaeon]